MKWSGWLKHLHTPIRWTRCSPSTELPQTEPMFGRWLPSINSRAATTSWRSGLLTANLIAFSLPDRRIRRRMCPSTMSLRIRQEQVRCLLQREWLARAVSIRDSPRGQTTIWRSGMTAVGFRRSRTIFHCPTVLPELPRCSIKVMFLAESWTVRVCTVRLHHFQRTRSGHVRFRIARILPLSFVVSRMRVPSLKMRPRSIG